MGSRTVRLDPPSEQLLRKIRRETGMSVSAALKLGLAKVARDLEQQGTSAPFEIYRALELGPGGYALAPARSAKAELRRVIARKHRR